MRARNTVVAAILILLMTAALTMLPIRAFADDALPAPVIPAEEEKADEQGDDQEEADDQEDLDGQDPDDGQNGDEAAPASPSDAEDEQEEGDPEEGGEPESQEPEEPATQDLPEKQEELPIDEPILVPAAPRRGHWEVSTAYGQGLQRYWIWDDDGSRAKNELIRPENGAGYYAYAKPDTTIVRGKWDKGNGHVYIADENGKLLGSDRTEDGFIVTKDYDGGWQRYYVSASAKAARSGFFTVPGYGDVFGVGGEGYIKRGDFTFGGKKFSADNDGRLRSGWYVTSGFGQGLQRYWMGDTAYGSPHAAATNRLVRADTDGSGYYAWAMADSTILRGKWDNKAGYTYVADNNGKLIGSDLTKDGFVVTSLYDGVLRRYYVSAATKAARSGFIRVPSYGDCFGIGGEGYLLQGARPFGNSVIIADVHCRLPQTAGWLCSDAYGQKLQRYWVEEIYKDFMGTKPGYSTAGYAHYTVDAGYVLRNGTIIKGATEAYTADNSGRAKRVMDDWIHYGGHWYFVSSNPNAHYDFDINEWGGSLGHHDVIHDLWLKIKAAWSATQYLIASSWDACYLVVFEGEANNWRPLYGWNVCNGLPSKIEEEVEDPNWRWNPVWDYQLAEYNTPGRIANANIPPDNYWANYLGTSFSASRVRRVDAQEQYFTSVDLTLGYHTWLSTPRELGKHLSYGCQRLEYENAKWIYDNIYPYTRCLQLRTSRYY